MTATGAEPASGSGAARYGWMLLVACGAILVAGGMVAVVLAATIKLLPNDTAALGMSIAELDRFADGRIVDFLAHDRLAMAGSLIAIGSLYLWLAAVPVRAGESWAWWTLAISGAVGFASFLSYLGYGYLDWIHALVTVSLLAVFVTGMALSRRQLRAPRTASAALRGPLDAAKGMWRRRAHLTARDLGRAGLIGFALGSIGSGATIMALGLSGVFVPQDLDFIGLDAAAIKAINPNLVPVIAHDRAEFGGGLICIGFAMPLLVAHALPADGPTPPALWWALVAALSALAGGAILSHPVIGYTDLLHLLPAYASAALSVAVLVLLRPRAVRVDDDGPARVPHH